MQQKTVGTPSVLRNYANGSRLEILKSLSLILYGELVRTIRVNAVYGEGCSENLSAFTGIAPATIALRLITNWWTPSQRIRKIAEMPFDIELVEICRDNLL